MVFEVLNDYHCECSWKKKNGSRYAETLLSAVSSEGF